MYNEITSKALVSEQSSESSESEKSLQMSQILTVQHFSAIGGIRLGSFTLGPVAGVLFARSAVPALDYTRAYALANVLLTIARRLVLLFD